MSQYLLAVTTVESAETTARAPRQAALDDDVQLLDRYLFDGDDAALVTLYDRHNHRLFLYCLKLLGSSEQAEDLTQELWERVARLRARPQHILNPTGFFLRIARNLSLNQLKARKRMSPLDDVSEGALPSYSPYEPTELEDIALRALNGLPDDYREVLILNLYSGYRLDEIAQLLGKSPDAIRKRASRARIYLRERVMQLIEEQGGDPAIVLPRVDFGDREESR